MSNRVVLKWPMPYPVMDFDLPVDAMVIDVREQDGVPTIWTLSATSPEREKRTFVTHGEGAWVWEGDGDYVGSAHLVGGLVIHVFLRPRVDPSGKEGV